MGTPRRGSFRLLIVAAAAAGVVLAAPVAAIAEQAAPGEALPTEPSGDSITPEVPTDQPVTDDALTNDEIAQEPVAESWTIDLTVEETSPADQPPDADHEGDDSAPPTSTTTDATLEEPTSGEHTGGGGNTGTDAEHTGTDAEHTGGDGEHTGGGGQGDPYRMTFSVTWRSPDDQIIPTDLLSADLRSMFDLAGASATGSGKPTSAHCTYPAGGSELICDFDNPGHGSGPDGMVVPKKKTATYTVTVQSIADWTIDGANAGPYSAWDLCPRSNDGTGGGHASEALEGETGGQIFGCNHMVVMRQVEPAVEPPAVEPPPTEPPTTPPPVTEPPPDVDPVAVPPADVTPAPPPAVASVAATPRTLPATGNQLVTTLLIGSSVFSIGGCLALLARRRTSAPPVG